MKQLKTFWLTPFTHVVPADYEDWFEKLAKEGWHPVKVGQWSSIAMRFAKAEPKTYRYVADMQALPKKDYRPTWEEFGWEYVGQMASMHVWRKQYTDVRPESFTDSASRQDRNRRFIFAVSVSFVLFLAAAIGFGAALFMGWFDNVPDGRIQGILITALMLAASAGLGLVILRIRKNIDK